MTPAEALLPHESHCPDCGGDGRVLCAGVSARSIGRVSAMTEPDEWYEDCETCDSTGVVIDERRSAPSLMREVWTDLQRAQHALAITQIELRASRETIDRLHVENKVLRATVADQGKKLERYEAARCERVAKEVASNRPSPWSSEPQFRGEGHERGEGRS